MELMLLPANSLEKVIFNLKESTFILTKPHTDMSQDLSLQTYNLEFLIQSLHTLKMESCHLLIRIFSLQLRMVPVIAGLLGTTPKARKLSMKSWITLESWLKDAKVYKAFRWHIRSVVVLDQV